MINRSRSSTPRFLAGKHRKQEDSIEIRLGATNSCRVPLRRQSLDTDVLVDYSPLPQRQGDVSRMNEKSSVNRETNGSPSATSGIHLVISQGMHA
jgi:hypothetical protein